MAYSWKFGLVLFVGVLLYYVDGATIQQPPVKYNELELKVLEDLKAQSESRGIGFEKPECWFEDFTAACCVETKYRSGEKDSKGKEIKKKHRTCIEAGIEFTALKAFLRAHHDGKILGKELAYRFGKLCWPLPTPLENLQACVWIWHVKVSISNKLAEACFLFSLTDFFHVRFDCIRWEDGKFSLHNKVLPKNDQALLTVYVGAEGIKFEVKNAKFFKKLWKNIKDGWKKLKGLFGKSKEMKNFIEKSS
uniref:Secreted venom family 2 protein n=1 Tax=Pristhesancus plagipennis TaxID=1955184 RepID=A0A2K8JMY1_PRIPG|nr:secreted venom family 2 protein [Pristhesancus plagipennis]